MKPDRGLERTREIRKKISREHGNDIKRLGEYYIDYQRQFAERLRWAPGHERASTEAAEQAAAAERQGPADVR